MPALLYFHPKRLSLWRTVTLGLDSLYLSVRAGIGVCLRSPLSSPPPTTVIGVDQAPLKRHRMETFYFFPHLDYLEMIKANNVCFYIFLPVFVGAGLKTRIKKKRRMTINTEFGEAVASGVGEARAGGGLGSSDRHVTKSAHAHLRADDRGTKDYSESNFVCLGPFTK